MDKLSFVAAAMKYLGRKPGQGLAEFSREVGALTPGDKQELAPLLAEALGIEVSA